MLLDISIELYKTEKGEKRVYISEENSTGSSYPYETADDIGEAVSDYLDGYFPEFVENPNYWEEELED